jgi:hypothetical protein
MIIRVDATRAVIEAPSAFDGFKVVATHGAEVGAIGRIDVDGEHVFVDPEFVRSLVGERRSDPEWESGFVAMIRYAEAKGWLDSNGHIRAHIERLD